MTASVFVIVSVLLAIIEMFKSYNEINSFMMEAPIMHLWRLLIKSTEVATEYVLQNVFLKISQIL